MKISTRTEQVIDVDDWDKLVFDTYGKPYSFQQQDGCKERQRVKITIPDEAYDYENDTIPEVINGDEMGVSFKAWLERDPNSARDIFWERNFYPDVQMIANSLYRMELIEAGTYTIDIDW
jgi:hypothetical protein